MQEHQNMSLTYTKEPIRKHFRPGLCASNVAANEDERLAEAVQKFPVLYYQTQSRGNSKSALFKDLSKSTGNTILCPPAVTRELSYGSRPEAFCV